jgi:Ca2+-binding RTX toxin-like protein
MHGRGREARRAARVWTVMGLALLGAAAVPAAAAATTATVEGEVIRIIDTEGIDDRIVISAGGGDSEGVAWKIDGADGIGPLCFGTGEATCTDGRFRDFDAPTRRFVIDLGDGDDELVYAATSGHAGDEPEGEIDLGPGEDELESTGLEAHTVDAGPGDDALELSGFAPSGPGGPPTAGPSPRSVILEGGLGRDTFDMARRHSADTVLGGAGIDLVTYANRTPAVAVSLNGVADDGTGEEGDDIQPDVEELIGTSAGDSLVGDGGDQVIDGGLGADALVGLGGADTLSFASRSAAVVADLDAEITSDGDLIDGFEHLRGGGGGDRLTGDLAANAIEGGGGEDRLHGGAGADSLTGGPADDMLDGGPDAAADLLTGDAQSSDTADYRTRTQAVKVALAEGGVEALTLDGDRLVRIANVFGGSAADRLIGNTRANELRGGEGDDRIDGRAGDDVLRGLGGRDVIGALRAVPFGFCTFELGQGQVCTLDFFLGTAVPDGSDEVRGGADGDILSTRDVAQDDTITCGAGTDSLRRDAVDPAPVSCETVRIG